VYFIILVVAIIAINRVYYCALIELNRVFDIAKDREDSINADKNTCLDEINELDQLMMIARQKLMAAASEKNPDAMVIVLADAKSDMYLIRDMLKWRVQSVEALDVPADSGSNVVSITSKREEW
jgi:hypothetical protein